MPLPVPAAIAALTTSLASTSVLALIAQISEAPGGVVTITSAGATASAVAALVYVVRKLVTGDLVAKHTAEDAEAATKAVAQLVGMLERAEKREDRFYAFITAHGMTPPEH